MKKLAVFLVLAMVAGYAFGQGANWMGNSYFIFNADGAGADWYNGSGVGNPELPADFGLVSSLVLGGQVQSFGDNDGASNPAFLSWRVDGAETWNQIELAWSKYENNNNYFENTAGANVANGLAAGSHTLAMYFSKPSTDPDATEGYIYDSNGGGNFNTAFTTPIPEPATMSLLGLGAMAMVLRRKLRK